MEKKILNWFATGRVGLSSKAMACCVLGIKNDNSHPYDPDDFNRCLLFLKAVPEVRGCFDEIAKMSNEWKALIENWEAIETMFLCEVDFDWLKNRHAPNTYDFMNKVLTEA